MPEMKTSQEGEGALQAEPPFPYFHLSVLLSTGFISGMSLTGLFPYISFMVVHLQGGDINHAGYMTGVVASSFMVGRLFSSFYWGRAADRMGRKPVFYISLLSIAIMSIVFGMSVNIYMAIAARLCLGFMNPISGLMKTVVSEVCIDKHQPFAMSVVSASWSVGLVIGPAIGGYTSEPEKQYPGTTLGGIILFQIFPFLLPNIITAISAIGSMTMVYLFLPETLKKVSNEKNYEMVKVYSSDVDEENDAGEDEGGGGAYKDTISYELPGEDEEENLDLSGKEESLIMSFIHLMQEKRVRTPIFAYAIISYMSIVYDEVLPLWALSEAQKGGLDYSTKHVGLLISLTGVPMILFTVFIFPRLANALGRIQCYRVGQLSFAMCSFAAVCVPIFRSYVWPDMPLFWGLLFCSSCAKMSSCMAFTAVFLIINASVSSEKRASVNGLAMTFGSVAKALGPACGSIIFAWSINNATPLPPSLSYLIVFLLSLVMAVIAFFFMPSSSLSGSTPHHPSKLEIQ